MVCGPYRDSVSPPNDKANRAGPTSPAHTRISTRPFATSGSAPRAARQRRRRPDPSPTMAHVAAGAPGVASEATNDRTPVDAAAKH